MRFSYQLQLQQLLQAIRAGKLRSAQQWAKYKGCHPSTIERQLKHLRRQGHLIVYLRASQQYQLVESDPFPNL